MDPVATDTAMRPSTAHHHPQAPTDIHYVPFKLGGPCTKGGRQRATKREKETDANFGFNQLGAAPQPGQCDSQLHSGAHRVLFMEFASSGDRAREESSEESSMAQFALAEESSEESSMARRALAEESSEESSMAQFALAEESSEESSMARRALAEESSEESSMAQFALAEESSEESSMARRALAEESSEESSMAQFALAEESSEESSMAQFALAEESSEESSMARRALAEESSEESSMAQFALAEESSEESSMARRALAEESSEESSMAQFALAEEVEIVACAYFKNKQRAYKEPSVYVMTDGKEQPAAITQAAVNQVVYYLLAEHDMDMRQLYMWPDGCAGQFKGVPAMRQHWGMAQRPSITKPFEAMPMFDQKRDDKHWDDECFTLLCSFAPDSVKQLCTLGKKLSVKTRWI
ncbi:hypothetical protein QJQ45_014010, partial [Haematococcus lacustris]